MHNTTKRSSETYNSRANVHEYACLCILCVSMTHAYEVLETCYTTDDAVFTSRMD